MIELKNKRISCGLTQKQVADYVGVEPHTVSQWESGVREPRVAVWPKLAQLFECSVDELLGIKKTPADKQA